MSEQFSPRSNMAIFSYALFLYRKHFFTFLFLFVLPLIIINLFGLSASFGWENLFGQSRLSPFSLYVYQPAGTFIMIKRQSIPLQKHNRNWSVVYNLPRKHTLAIRLLSREGPRTLTLSKKDLAKHKAAWLKNGKLQWHSPADFNVQRLKLPPPEQRFAVQFSILLLTLLLMAGFFWYCIHLVFFGNGFSVGRSLRIFGKRLAPFLGTGVLLAVIYTILLLFSMLNPLVLVVLFLTLTRILTAPLYCLLQSRRPLEAVRQSWRLSRGNSIKVLAPLLAFAVLLVFLFAFASAIASLILESKLPEISASLLQFTESGFMLWPRALLTVFAIFLGGLALLFPLAGIYLLRLSLELYLREHDYRDAPPTVLWRRLNENEN